MIGHFVGRSVNCEQTTSGVGKAADTLTRSLVELSRRFLGQPFVDQVQVLLLLNGGRGGRNSSNSMG